MKFCIKINLFLILFLSHTVGYAQALDPSFLDSLPDNMKEDILSRNLDDEGEDKNIYNPDTKINKIAEDLRLAEQMLDRIRLSIDEDKNSTGELKRFGESFFSSYQSSFIPINTPNFGADYILDIGDEISLQLVGQINRTFKLLIKRDGAINVPNVGKINIAGLALQAAFDLIDEEISKSLIGAEAFISLSKLRDINVLIVGGVNSPGMYTLSGGSTPLSLISMAGGIKPSGTYRSIVHKRNQEVLAEIDLYNIFVNGDISNLKSLRSGDVLVIGPSMNEVRVSGGVANPAIFELKSDENLGDLLNFAGILAHADIGNLILKTKNNKTLVTSNFSYPRDSNKSLQSGDAIEVPFALPIFAKAKKIKLTGEVNIPGEYSITDETKISDIINLAGGFTQNAYPLGGVLTRQSVKNIENDIRDRSYKDLLRFFLASESKVMGNNEAVISFLSLLKEYDPSGRVIANFEPSILQKNPSLDKLLLDGDEIHIPSFASEVYVFGEAMNPGGFNYNSSMNAKDYLGLAGGFTRNADDSRIIIIFPNGSSQLITNGLFNFNFANKDILPGTVIYVPRHIGKIDGINLASAIAPILSSFALSIASLNSINN